MLISILAVFTVILQFDSVCECAFIALFQFLAI